MRPSLAHAGQQTTEPATAHDFEQFCERQVARARGRASQVVRRYRERLTLALRDDHGMRNTWKPEAHRKLSIGIAAWGRSEARAN